jgi:hypothetical protein
MRGSVFLAVVVLGACARSAHERCVACEAEGGRLAAGMSGEGPCVFPTRDGGKPCRDTADCEFECWATTSVLPPGTLARGTCAEWPIEFGCHDRVVKGRTQGMICID